MTTIELVVTLWARQLMCTVQSVVCCVRRHMQRIGALQRLHCARTFVPAVAAVDWDTTRAFGRGGFGNSRGGAPRGGGGYRGGPPHGGPSRGGYDNSGAGAGADAHGRPQQLPYLENKELRHGRVSEARAKGLQPWLTEADRERTVELMKSDESRILRQIMPCIPHNGAIAIKKLGTLLQETVLEALAEKYGGLKSFLETRKQLFVVKPHGDDNVLYVAVTPQAASMRQERDAQKEALEKALGIGHAAPAGRGAGRGGSVGRGGGFSRGFRGAARARSFSSARGRGGARGRY